MLTEEQIAFLNSVCPYRWAECNGVINVNGGVDISRCNLIKIPVQFGRIEGSFNCCNNKLTSLKGCPSIVNWNFKCDSNQLTSLRGGPKEVTGYYNCSDNLLTNLIGAPEMCNDNFYCCSNKLTSLKGCPKIIKRFLSCTFNPNLRLLGVNKIKHIEYDLNDELNYWIAMSAIKGITFPYITIEKNINLIKKSGNYSSLTFAPKKIQKYFKYELNYINNLC